MSKPEIITIDGVKYVRADSVTQQATPMYGLKYVIVRTYSAGVFAGDLESRIVRTYSAGVFAGDLESRIGQEVVLRNARRILYWEGAASLSQLAECKFSQEISRVELLQVIEILDLSKKAQEFIASMKAIDMEGSCGGGG